MGSSSSRIFIAISSYRDPDCQWTVNDAFAKAKRPERINVGLCWQYDALADGDCFSKEYTHPEQVRALQYTARDSQGKSWARAQALSLWQQEEFILLIDSHTRFVQDWDEIILKQWHACGTTRAVLTGWLPRYEPNTPLPATAPPMPRIIVSHMAEANEPRLLHLNYSLPTHSDEMPTLSALCISTMLFAPAQLFREVPPDPHIHDEGFEINYSLRLWTHGYDLFQPGRVIGYHYWDKPKDNKAAWPRERVIQANSAALKRNLSLLGLNKDAMKEPYALGKNRSLDAFWEFSGVDLYKRTLSAKARQGAWQNAQHQAYLPRIFVNIASYRDPECQPTIHDLFAKAAHPERVFIGVCMQIDPALDKDCRVTHERLPQLRIREVDYRESKGANWARAQAQELWNGEEYTLQIDSHMRVEPGWDEDLIAMLARCPNPRAVLSTYAPGYDPPDEKDHTPGKIYRLRIYGFGATDTAQLLHLTRIAVPYSDTERSGLYPCPFYAANFLFCRSETLLRIPFDPHIQFWGDEITFSARLWTHGYTIYQPDKVVIYHYWRRTKSAPQDQHYRSHRSAGGRKSTERVRHIIGLEQASSPEALIDINAYGLGNVRPLEKLWDYSGVNLQTREMTKRASAGRWNIDILAETDEQAARRAVPRIFVQIASYRDPDCQWTVKDLFDKAAHPERIFVGICWQYNKQKDELCFQVQPPYPGQVRTIDIDASESKGVCWARSLTQTLWKGEEYTLQIDSHMRFEPGWDSELLDMWDDCHDDKAVLTAYPPGFTPPDKIDRGWVLAMSAKEFNAEGILTMIGAPGFKSNEAPPAPMPGAFASACMLFGPSSIIADIPYDPYLYFFGEEISLTVRLWTHGYNLYHPNKTVVYHDWERGKRHTHFDDYKDWSILDKRSFARVRHLLGTEVIKDNATLQDIAAYGLGTERTLEAYEQYSGIDFKQKTISEHALKGKFSMPKQAMKKSNITHTDSQGNRPRIFVNIASYRDRECQWTVKDLFEKATYPDRVFVGICWQFDEEEDKDCFEVSTRPEQVRVFPIDWREAKGVCWARHTVQQLWEGEEYNLMIDSHMRFVPGWDELMIAELAACDAKKPVLSCNPAQYTPPNNLQKNPSPAIRRVRPFTPGGNIRGAGQGLARVPETPLNGAFISAGFVFSRSDIITEVPYDPYMYFDQEEITYAMRLYTHGWDIFSARTQFLYHYYNNEKESVRPLHWKDMHKEDDKHIKFLMDRGLMRFNHLSGYRVSTDPEVIKELDSYGLGTERTLEEFEAYCGVDFKRKIVSERAMRCQFVRGLEKYLNGPIYIPELDGPTAVKPAPKPDNAATQATALATMQSTARPRIFVNIASYRDPECQWTVKDLFEKAMYPDRVFVGICWQFDEEKDKNCFQVSTRPEQVRVMPVDWRESEGVCWARHVAEQLWDGEEYTLQIDSHMRFTQGWDELMIAELAACASSKSLLSSAPPGYTPPNNLPQNPQATVRHAQPFMPDGNIRCKGEYISVTPEKPLRGAFVVGNFIFAKSDILKEVPYDPYMYFDQEEITYGLRLYTHGWDVYHTRRPFLFHYYNDAPGGSTRPLHWRDTQDADRKRIEFLRERGIKRFNHLTDYQQSHDPAVLKEFEKYGLGMQRSLKDYEHYTGIDFKRKVASERALRCLFIEDVERYRGRGQTTSPEKIIVPETTLKPSLPIVEMPNKKLRLLDPGDFLPLFHLEDTNRKWRGVEPHAGRFTLLFYLPANNPAYVGAFMRQLKEAFAKYPKMNIWQIFVADGTVAQLQQLKSSLSIEHVFFADGDRALAYELGIAKAGDITLPPVGFILNRNLQVMKRYVNQSPELMATAIVADCNKAINEAASYTPRIISEIAPALIVPNALTPELCQKCITSFKTGYRYEGTVGAEERAAYTPTAKVRTDHVLRDALLAEVDEKLSVSLFPEIKKVFGVEITHRELYKIGMYSGEKSGFFKQHRDNFEEALGYRRIACTIQLTDDYEGGGLRFPEYGDDIFRPAAGSAIAFSCATVHEALPVTSGERYVVVAFMHGRQDEAYRRHYLSSKGQPLKNENFIPTIRAQGNVYHSRDFEKQWREANVSLNEPSLDTAKIRSMAASDTPHVRMRVNIGKPHQPLKVFESAQAIIFDDFLPEDAFQRVVNHVIKMDYEYINTHGNAVRAWRPHDGFPLRGNPNYFYYPDESTMPQKQDYIYPTKGDMDVFIEQMQAIQPKVEHLIGKPKTDWTHCSYTAWAYPQGTSLSLHDDGSGVYAGAYVFFLNQVWKPHWGGLLLLIDEEGNRIVHEHRNKVDQSDFYKRQWFSENSLDEMLMEHGFAKCIFPKKNRIVFIANDAYHMVTRVNEPSGDNIRHSLAGFFQKKK